MPIPDPVEPKKINDTKRIRSKARKTRMLASLGQSCIRVAAQAAKRLNSNGEGVAKAAKTFVTAVFQDMRAEDGPATPSKMKRSYPALQSMEMNKHIAATAPQMEC